MATGIYITTIPQGNGKRYLPKQNSKGKPYNSYQNLKVILRDKRN